MNKKLLKVLAVMLLSLLIGRVGGTASQQAQASGGQKDNPEQQGQQARGQAVVQSAPLAPAGAGFSYQGRLVVGGSPASGNYDFTFSLFDAATGGTQIGNTITVLNQILSIGTFTTVLDFGVNAFAGSARWLQIALRPSGQPTFTTLSPRQAFTPAPYAISLVPGAQILGTSGSAMFTVSNSGSGNGIYGYSASGTALYGLSTNGYGVYGWSASGRGVYGQSTGGNAVQALSDTGTGVAAQGGNGVYGVGTGSGGAGVWGVDNTGSSAAGVYGTSSSGYGVQGISTATNGRGIYGAANSGSTAAGVYGSSSVGYGVQALSTSGTGLLAQGGNGIYSTATANNGIGVLGTANNGDSATGVRGNSSSHYGQGVYGYATGDSLLAYGVFGNAPDGIGVEAQGAFGLEAAGSSYAGVFWGDVLVNGSCCGAGEGAYKIDHPLDPANKTLTQSAIESDEMLGVYSGNLTLDEKGEATVQMPSWFEALNKDFRYQLTAIGAPGPNLYIAEKFSSDHFKIAGGKPGSEVSWQVTGVRHDPYAEQHPIQVEQQKTGDEQGKYLYPSAYGQPKSMGVDYERRQRVQPQDPGANIGHP